jgi:cell division protein FtsI (penicillin-binding protein 3)
MKYPTMQLTRTMALRAGLLVVLSIFVMRLFYLQVIRHDYYVAEANKLQISKETIIPKRGEIYALDKGNPVPLVLNEAVFTVIADPHAVVNVDKVENVIRRVAGGEAVKDLSGLKNTQSRYMVLARQVTRAQAELIKKEDLNGIYLQATSRRIYPEGTLAAQTLGFVDAEGVGRYGVEGSLQDELRGIPGLLQTVTDVRRIPLTIGPDSVRVPAKNGDNVVLTIDRGIQAKTEEVLRNGLVKAKATRGSVLVMDPTNGAILAMASTPSFDPAKYSSVTDYADFQNGIVSSPYEAGSVIKTLTMATGFDTGVIKPGDTFNNTGYVRVDDRIIKNVEEDPINPNATMLDILKFSLNTGVVHVLQLMGDGKVNQKARERLYEYYANKYYFGQKTGIEQAGEAAGEMYSPDDTEGNNVRYANMAFGQGMTVTVLQMAAAFSAVVNGGTYYQPHLVAGTLDDSGSFTAKTYAPRATRIISPEASAQATLLIHQGRSQGLYRGYDKPGYIVGGKTGTAQTIDPKTGQYSNTNTVGSYLGFGGSTTPKYVIMVRVDDAKIAGYTGNAAAAPIFNALSDWMIDYLQLQPAS